MLVVCKSATTGVFIDAQKMEKVTRSADDQLPPLLSDYESIRIEDNEDETEFEYAFLPILFLNSPLNLKSEHLFLYISPNRKPVELDEYPLYLLTGKLTV